MKKTLLLSLVLLLVTGLSAQNLCTFMRYSDYYMQSANIMETYDNNLIYNCQLLDSYGNDVGIVLYKVSPEGVFLDSVYMRDNDFQLMFLLERNPLQEEGFIFAKTVRDATECTSTLKIQFFSDDMDMENEVSVQVLDTTMQYVDYYLDPNNDIIIQYVAGTGSGRKYYHLRVGLDGTIKNTVEMPFPFIGHHSQLLPNLGLYNTDPLMYCFCARQYNPEVTSIFVLDSLLRPIEQSNYNSALDANGVVKYYNDDRYLMTSQYSPLNGPQGVHLSMFDKSHEIKQKKIFTEGAFWMPFPIGMEKVQQGGVYYSYVTSALGEYVAVVKLTDGLEVEWIRYCLDADAFHWGNYIRALDNGGVAVGGFDSSSGPDYFRVWLLILTDEGVSTPEMEAYVRPYCVYPNPVQDRLTLELSPDVRLERTELYDMGGRLLKQQGGATSLDMQTLPTGNYLLKLFLEGGKVYTEKIVKE